MKTDDRSLPPVVQALLGAVFASMLLAPMVLLGPWAWELGAFFGGGGLCGALLLAWACGAWPFQNGPDLWSDD